MSSLYNIIILAGAGQSYFSLVLSLNLIFDDLIGLLNFLDVSKKIIEEHKFCWASLIFEFLFGNKFTLLIKLEIISEDS
jgi:hypothetical protein